MSVLEKLSGRILDSDSHEMYPARLWPEVFGEATAPLAALLQQHSPDAPNTLNAAVERDEAELTEETAESVWGAGSYAPGSFDMRRRLEMMDFFGIDKQLIFASGVGMVGMMCVSDPPAAWLELIGMPETGGIDLPEIGRLMCTMYNDWCISVSQVSPRLRPVAFIDSTSMEGAIAEFERVYEGGVRAVLMPSGLPPGGKAPGHPDLDPLWRTFTEHNVPLLLHSGTDFGLLRSGAWHDYGFDAATWGQGSQLAVGSQNYLTSMIYGGVFERHPELYVGCVEMGAYWIGPMAENTDYVAEQFSRRLSKVLSLKPSEYIRRNVRCSSWWWEDIDKYIERQGLEDVYIFGSDYPHFEGGKDPLNRQANRLARLGETVAEKFFVHNPSVLLP
jgi:predicted TIM-barrel fold metal-dependent hydrolase